MVALVARGCRRDGGRRQLARRGFRICDFPPADGDDNVAGGVFIALQVTGRTIRTLRAEPRYVLNGGSDA
jgi:hypothetical protein